MKRLKKHNRYVQVLFSPVFSAFITVLIGIFIWYHPPGTSLNFFKNVAHPINNLKQVYGSPSKPNESIIIVSIDEAALAEHGLWPWARKFQGEFYSKLATANLIGADILYLEESNDDTAFANQLAELPKLVAAFTTLPDSKPASEITLAMLEPHMIRDIRIKDRDQPEDSSIYLPELSHLADVPLTLLPYLAKGGLVNIDTDSNETQPLYHIGMVDYDNGYIFPSFGLQVIQTWLDKIFSYEVAHPNVLFLDGKKGSYISLDNPRGLRLNYYKNDFQVISVADIMKEKFPKNTFDNKLVLIGFMAEGLYDSVNTPLGRKKGIEVHATFVSNVLNDELMQSDQRLEKLLFCFFAVFPWLVCVFVQRQSLVRSGAALCALLLLFTLDILLFSSQYIALNTFLLLSVFVFSTLANESIIRVKQEYYSGKLRSAFQSYLSKELLQIIVKNPDKIEFGGHRKTATFLFSDIRDFTSLSEQITPEELVNTLNSYFTPMTQCIFRHKGMLDKYIGDAVMAIFNSPIELPDHALHSCLCALDMLEELEACNRERAEKGMTQIKMGIGVNTGDAVIGNMGSSIRFSYTAMGDAVNTASRIEGATKNYDCSILIGESTWECVKDELLWRYVDAVHLKGKELPCKLYEILPNTDRNRDLCALFANARHLYSDGKIPEAFRTFRSCYELYGDGCSSVFMKRCQEVLN